MGLVFTSPNDFKKDLVGRIVLVNRENLSCQPTKCQSQPETAADFGCHALQASFKQLYFPRLVFNFSRPVSHSDVLSFLLPLGYPPARDQQALFL